MALLFANGNFYRPVPPFFKENGKEDSADKILAICKLLGAFVWIIVFLKRKPIETSALIILYLLFIKLKWEDEISAFFNGKRKTLKK